MVVQMSFIFRKGVIGAIEPIRKEMFQVDLRPEKQSKMPILNTGSFFFIIIIVIYEHGLAK
jgi:hypothetical protein